ncbi:MAG TPA: 30S ribosomal protein S12 methylthiotransferase RimO [Acidimicrobiales bacterium]|nr:30S ribosomal protein S12 methylthiotransferase RimO [Acidimicrobiales bacterium]
MTGTYWVETLGCPKNRVDSDKLAGQLEVAGLSPAESPADADTVVVNTCAFIEAAREESIDTILELSAGRRSGSRLVVTGCMAERYGEELASALPEVDLVAGFGSSLNPAPKPVPEPVPIRLHKAPPTSFDLLNLPRPAHRAPWAYVKVAEGCDRRCGFCAIPSFRGRQRSRDMESILCEVESLGQGVREVVLVAQDLASWGLDRTGQSRNSRRAGPARPIVELVGRVADRVDRVRLLYLYPSSLDDDLIDAVGETGVPYYDLSLQHVSRPLLKQMRRWGDSASYFDRIARIRSAAPEATLRSSFILGYPGETEEDHDRLLEFLEEAELDWAGFFTFSMEEGTHAARLANQVAPELAMERLRECSEVQERITTRRRLSLVGRPMEVLVDAPEVARSYREAPEIDGVVHVPSSLVTGAFHEVVVTDSSSTDLWGEPLVQEGVRSR